MQGSVNPSRLPASRALLQRSGTRLPPAAEKQLQPMSLDGTEKDTFECELCGLTAPYSYYGHKPPNAFSVTLLEDCYVMKDPFSPDKDRFLILGAQCSVCHKRVCVGPDCSLFYSKRFCLPCVKARISEFPLEIEEDLKKKDT